MKIVLLSFILLILTIMYLLHKIEKQKIKIIYLSRQNYSLTNKYNEKKINMNSMKNLSNIEIKFIKIHTHIAFLKNTTFIKIAPIDFAPKIVNIQKNTEVKILSKILIEGEYWYEIIINSHDLSYNLKWWIKDYGVEFIYPKNQDLPKTN